MQTRPLGPSGIDASVVGFGAWAIGGWMWGGSSEPDAIRAIHAAIDAGMNLIDTAAIYGFGVSEEFVGKALKDRRERAVIATKCGLVVGGGRGVAKFRSSAAGISEHGHVDVWIYCDPDSIRAEVERSLARLQTDYIDVYQTHWQDTTTPIADTMDCLLELKQAGKIRAIGACNASREQLSQYTDRGQLDSDQEKYSMLDRNIETAQLPFCREHKLAMLAYSPLAMGMLTGKVGPDRQFGGGDVRNRVPRFSIENRATVAGMLDQLKPIAADRGLTLAQLVIAWTASQPGVTHILCGARNPEQVEENAVAGRSELSRDSIAAIDTVLEQFAGGIV